jgi:type II secretory pathway component GspD/PulD (secretin)
VATTLKVTPRVNSNNRVTLEVIVEVSEVEDSPPGFDAASSGGFITSKREVETTALVGDNQTVVLGGLVGTTESRSEKKVPILGDIPVIGELFRSQSVDYRKTNLMIFLTPHIVDDDEDMVEIMKVKEAQRQEFIRRFYGKSRDEQMQAIQELLKYSMNFSGEPSQYRGNELPVSPEGASYEDEAGRVIEEMDMPAEPAEPVEPEPGAPSEGGN